MNDKTFLITGATGSTGRSTIDLLLARGHQVRALVHREDARSDALKAQGAEIFVGDLADFETIRPALEGIFGAYFVFPIQPGLIEATTYFAQAAREANISAIVNMSQISARREAKSHAAFNHWIAERVFDWSGVPVTHIKPTFFAEWMTYPGNVGDIRKGLVQLGFKDGKHAPIAAQDQARFIASVLEDPAPHQGKSYPLYGPKEYTHAELYAVVSQVLGREIRYETISDAALQEKITGWRHPFMAQHIAEVTKDHSAGVFSGTDHIIEAVTGQKPMGVEEFVEKNRALFIGNS